MPGLTLGNMSKVDGCKEYKAVNPECIQCPVIILTVSIFVD